MSAADLIQVEGVITKMHSGQFYDVRLDNGHLVFATLGGRLAKNKVKLTVADRVVVGLSPYDLKRGRIEARLDGARAVNSFSKRPRS